MSCTLDRGDVQYENMSMCDRVSMSIKGIGGRRTSQHRDLVMEWCRAPNEFVDLAVNGAFVEPFDKGVEEEPV